MLNNGVKETATEGGLADIPAYAVSRSSSRMTVINSLGRKCAVLLSSYNLVNDTKHNM